MIYRLIFVIALSYSGIALCGNFEDAERLRMEGKHREALALYEVAAKEGNPTASHWVGTYYLEGISVEINKGKAITYLMPAAYMGVPGSMVYLANMYYIGDGVPKDCAKSEYWIKKANNGILTEDWKAKLSVCHNSANNTLNKGNLFNGSKATH